MCSTSRFRGTTRLLELSLRLVELVNTPVYFRPALGSPARHRLAEVGLMSPEYVPAANDYAGKTQK